VAGNSDERATFARLADEVVPALIKRLGSSELGELEVRQDGWRVRLRRGTDGATQMPAAGHAALPHKPASVSHASEGQPRRDPPKGQVKSPAVGLFTLRDGVSVGSKVRRNDILGIVDVLGIRQEVVSPGDGVLKAIEVESGQAVEFGQPIGRIDANV
jgi:acetyl-CoA carboxylase biotin carboxyl carrier protein